MSHNPTVSPFKTPAPPNKALQAQKKRRLNNGSSVPSRKGGKKSSDETDIDADKLISMMDY